MNIVVTGGAGFIGSNFIFYMMKKYPEYHIVCLDKLTYAGNLSTLQNVIDSNRVKFIKGDICSKIVVDKIFKEEKPHIIVNFAAESHVDRSIHNPKYFFKNNAIGTAVLLDACREYGVERFHQISTDEVYGDIPLECHDLQFTEKTPIQTSSPYSASKAAADLLTMSYFKTFGVPVTISRCSNNYGPYQYPEKLIPLMIVKAMRNEPLPIYGNGLNIRNWLYVEDHCRAVDLIIHKGSIGEVYNIGGNNELTNLDVVRHILKELNKSEDLIKFVEDRPGHDRRYAVSAEKIRRELGWKPEIDFSIGLKNTVEWYLSNSVWWSPLLKN